MLTPGPTFPVAGDKERRLSNGEGTGGLSNREGAEATELKNLALGQSAEVTRTFTKADLQDYADLTGDKNPIYTDGAYAQRLGFQDAVIPGGLLGGLFSYLLGTRLPGPGTNWLKQSLQFFAPAYPGEEMTATAQIVRLRPEKDLINLRTVCTKSSGEVVCAGEALVLVRDI
jgi:acyl dehydratase